MQIHTLSTEKKKGRKRIGRGGRRGTTAGRGSNGQKSRTGSSVDPLFEGGRTTLLERMKKVKGFKSPRAKRVTLPLSLLEKHFEAGEEVSRATIIGKKLFSPKHTAGGFKVVSGGELTKKLSFDSKIRFSESALSAVKKAGCTVREEA